VKLVSIKIRLPNFDLGELRAIQYKQRQTGFITVQENFAVMASYSSKLSGLLCSIKDEMYGTGCSKKCMKLRYAGPYMCLQQIVFMMTSLRAATVVTHLFNPAVVAAFTFLLLLQIDNNLSPLFVAVCLTFGTFVPLAIIYLLSKRGLISDFFVSKKNERAKPFAGAILSYLAGSLTLCLFKAPPIITALMLCYGGNTLVMMLITRRWKISVHASGIAGPTTVLIESLGAWASVFFAFLVPVAWARLRLNAHTPTQILAGALVTVAATWVQLRIYLAVL
jgi:membrane-associated phospholipid phosphatase